MSVTCGQKTRSICSKLFLTYDNFAIAKSSTDSQLVNLATFK